MTNYNVKWSVKELINGEDFDRNRHHGERIVVASGEVDREAESPEAINKELTAVLEKSFPSHAMGGTYEVDRFYDIKITEKV